MGVAILGLAFAALLVRAYFASERDRSAVVEVLAGCTGWVSGQDLARLARVDLQVVHRIIDRLTVRGHVRCRYVAGRGYYRLTPQGRRHA